MIIIDGDPITDEPEPPMSDAEKHAWCLKRTGYRAACVSPLTYAKIERAGNDMRHYVIWRPKPDYEPYRPFVEGT